MCMENSTFLCAIIIKQYKIKRGTLGVFMTDREADLHYRGNTDHIHVYSSAERILLLGIRIFAFLNELKFSLAYSL